MTTRILVLLLLIATPAAAQNPVTIQKVGTVTVTTELPVTITVPPATWPLPTGAATEATLAAINGKLPALVGGRVPVDGSGVTQPVSGSVTVTQATGTNLHIVCDGGTCGGASPFADNSAFTFGTSGISNIGFIVDDVATNAVAENSAGAPRMTGNRIAYADLSLTGANATALKVDGSAVTQPVSGTVTATGPLTDAQLRAVPVPVSGTVAVTATNLDIHDLAFATDKVDVSGSTGVGVTGTFFQATQPISAAALPLPAGAATAALQTQPGVDIGDVTINNAAGAGAVNIQDGGNSITVDGSVTANAGTNLNTSALALSATQTDGTQQTQLTDGTDIAAVTPASTAAASTDPALVVGLNPLSNGVTPPYRTASGNLIALNSAVTLTGVAPSLSLGSGNIGFSVQAATLVATLVAELSFDSTATWVATKFFDPTLQTFSTTRSKTLGNEEVGVIVSYSGVTNARIRVSVYTSGSAAAFLQSLPDNHNPVVVVQGASLVSNLVAAVNPWQVTIGDPATANYAAVKAASTAAAAADKALVVSLSPNSGAGGRAASGATKAGNPVQIGGVFNTTQPTVTTGQMVEAQATARGELMVSPGVSGFALTANQSVNVAQVAGTATSVNNGTADAGSTRVTLASDSTGNIATIGTSVTPGTAAANLGKAEDAAHTTGDTGVAVLGVRKDTATQTTSADADYAIPAVDAYSAQFMREDHPNRIKCGTAAVSTATALTLATGCGAPGAGLSIYITDISFASNAQAIAADTFPTIKYGTGGACGTGTTIIWGAFGAAGVQQTIFQSYKTPIKIPANNEVCWMNSTAGSKFVVISGFIAP